MNVKKYSDISLGQSTEVVHTITEEDIHSFGDLCGDYNPLHFDEEWATKTMFKGRIAHGLLTASFISTAIGMQLPGPGTIYIAQKMVFKRPVRIGDTITTRVEVIDKNDEKQHITLKTTCTNQDEIEVLDGEALITLLKMDD